MRQRLLNLLLALVLALQIPIPARAERRMVKYTLTPGTPIRLSGITWTCNRILIQMQAGGTGMGYVMVGVSSGASKSTAVQLAPATSASPGGAYTDSGPNIDLNKIWIDGDQADPVLVTFESNSGPGQ